MTDRAGLTAAALLAPSEDAPRLALADWLLDRDDPADRALGRFLAAGVVAARFRDADVVDDPAFYRALEDLADVASSGEPARWVADLGPGPLAAGGWGWDSAGDRVTVRVGGSTAVFERGMLAVLRVPLGDWLAAAPRALAAWPVERVEAADVPGVCFYVEPPAAGGWSLTAALTILPRREPPGRLARLRGTPDADYYPPPPAHRWSVTEEFPDRPALVEEASAASARLADDVKAQAGSWWPARDRGVNPGPG
jgi:uncharacterized protein (TIGR02996 family)